MEDKTNQLSDTLYNCLFADDPIYFEKMKSNSAISWIYNQENPTYEKINSIIHDEEIESRIRFLASYIAIKKGLQIKEKYYFGTILEIPVKSWYDILAFYSDLKARYYNFSGAKIIYEGGNKQIDELIKNTNKISEAVCNVIGPWEKARLDKPKGNIARFSYLVSDGLYFGQGPIDLMSKDKMGSSILASGSKLMLRLINSTDKKV